MNRNEKKRIETLLQENLSKQKAIDAALAPKPRKRKQLNIKFNETDELRLAAIARKWEVNVSAAVRRLIMEKYFSLSQKGEV